jgi:Trk K+ transport system NAD-binding subunit
VLGEFVVDKESGLEGHSIGEVFASPDLVIVAVRSERGMFIYGPAPSTTLALGDRLLVFGPEDQLAKVGPASAPTPARG